jgi:hypothetical protein
VPEDEVIPGNLLAQIRVQATGEARDAEGRLLDADGECTETTNEKED